MKDSNRRNKSKKKYCSTDSVDDRGKARKFKDRGSYEVSRMNRFVPGNPLASPKDQLSSQQA